MRFFPHDMHTDGYLVDVPCVFPQINVSCVHMYVVYNISWRNYYCSAAISSVWTMCDGVVIPHTRLPASMLAKNVQQYLQVEKLKMADETSIGDIGTEKITAQQSVAKFGRLHKIAHVWVNESAFFWREQKSRLEETIDGLTP